MEGCGNKVQVIYEVVYGNEVYRRAEWTYCFVCLEYQVNMGLRQPDFEKKEKTLNKPSFQELQASK